MCNCGSNRASIACLCNCYKHVTEVCKDLFEVGSPSRVSGEAYRGAAVLEAVRGASCEESC